MTDRRDIGGAGGEATPDPQSSSPPPGAATRPEEGERQPEGWLERLKAAVGLKPVTIREELEVALAEGADGEDSFSPVERAMLRNIVRLRELRVEDVMAPRADIDALEETASVAEVILKFRETGHSRIPVYRESLDDPVGMVLLKDVLNFVVRPRNPDDAPGADGFAGFAFAPDALQTTLVDAKLVREVLFVPPTMPVIALLGTMQSRRMQMALVIDEYGGTDGLVSIEDAVETVVGEIEDEHDEDGPMIVAGRDGGYEVDGRATLEEVAEAIDPALAGGPEGEEVETIGGLVFSLLGRIPAPGEKLRLPAGNEVEILATDTRRIKRLKVFPRPPDAEAGVLPAAPAA